MIAAGVVLTGGSAKMEGVIELAEEVFHAPVRLGLPQGVSGLVDVVRNPIHSTGVGLLLFGRENYLRAAARAPVGERRAQRRRPHEGVVPGQFLRAAVGGEQAHSGDGQAGERAAGRADWRKPRPVRHGSH